MNYLSHHYTARRTEPDASPLFFVGNVLPDLMVDSSTGRRLRARQIRRSISGDLARGIALHFAADRRFHGAPEFHAAMAEASVLLRDALDAGEAEEAAAAAPPPPRRLFFLAHVFVELALDAVLLRDDPGLADHFYAQFDVVSSDVAAAAAESLLDQPLPEFSAVLSRFTAARYLYDYAQDDGLAESLHRISRRAGLNGFPAAGERTRVGGAFTAFLPRARHYGPMLWQPPPDADDR